jgi:hypothetical protein
MKRLVWALAWRLLRRAQRWGIVEIKVASISWGNRVRILPEPIEISARIFRAGTRT